MQGREIHGHQEGRQSNASPIILREIVEPCCQAAAEVLEYLGLHPDMALGMPRSMLNIAKKRLGQMVATFEKAKAVYQ